MNEHVYSYGPADAVKAGVAYLGQVFTGWTPTPVTVRAFERSFEDAGLDNLDAIAWAFRRWGESREKPPAPASLVRLAREWQPPPAPVHPGPPSHEVSWAEGIAAEADRREAAGYILSEIDQGTVKTARHILQRRDRGQSAWTWGQGQW